VQHPCRRNAALCSVENEEARRGTNFCTSAYYDRCYRLVIDLWHGCKLARDYPSRLAVELRALLPQTPVTVINRGVNGETAQEMLARFDRDVLAAHPDLVLWQVGSNAVLLDRPIAPTGFLIDEGLRQLKVAGFDVVLIDPQYAPKVIAKYDEYDINLMVALISTASRDMHVNLFQRFALMRYWRLTKGLPFSAFLSKD
jgi:acyl-CoA thioesterase I